ncbi:phospholipase D family protein [Cognatiluteimonas weifangensis]|uniref:Phospholipase D family protein n=1 Tax=Cognatiluteimonas weifangensis TaxID=2303539 RepID=A0A372DPG5_9GAMM|nr:phospholipase D family protein [Luteimonas weifangensis]RFP61478.1 phospholipase D family protein [Luteimonas weifangensis]
MSRGRHALALLLALACAACATLSPAQRTHSAQIAQAARATALDCDRADACARPSSLHRLGARAFAQSAPGAPRHYALLLDQGQDALLARIDLIRSARTSIDLQTYIFDEDDAGHLFLDELLAAARRGVRVRLLVDQLSALKRVDTLAALAGAHANFSLRIYNPVLGRARLSYPQYLLAAACCWQRLNQRMHSKLLLVDGTVGITGGRNYQDDYYDWNDEYNFRDRDVLVAGPVAQAMAANFQAFWDDERSLPPAQLHDVGRRLLRSGVPALPQAPFEHPRRVAQVARAADDSARIDALAAAALPVGAVAYIADLPRKHRAEQPLPAPASGELRTLIESARDEVLLQTPYLVLSQPAQDLFRALHRRASPPRVIVSTNSLASTDSFITYALSYKYKRRYLRDFGFEIHEFKPFPADAPIDLAATGATLPPVPSEEEIAQARARLLAARADDGAHAQRYRRPLQSEYAALRYARRSANERVPLARAGVRIGLHAKSLVVDERVGVVGTHNFDPRSDHYNTESAVVIDDPAFARALAASIRRDIAPGNAWTIARRPDPPLFSGLEYTLAKISERMPIFDLWPVRYATSYEFVPGPDCPAPRSPFDPAFGVCHRPVGDFPEVALGLKPLLTRIFTAFGAGLAPIL